MILDTTARSIEILLGGAVTTNELPWVVSYADHTDETFIPATAQGVSNGTTEVTIVSAPAASTQRQLKYLNIYNADTVTAVVTIQLDDTTVNRIMMKVTLPVGYQLVYTDTTGWTVLDEQGQLLLLQSLSDEAVPKSIVDAKGDLIAGSADNSVIRVAPPAHKYSTLYFDSAQSGGLAWDRRRYVQMEPFSFVNDGLCVQGDGKGTLHVPAHLDGLDLVECHVEVKTAGTTGVMKVQIRNATQAVNMLTTEVQVDSGETGSDTAATPYDIDENNDDIAENDILALDFEQLHTTPATGSIVTLGFA